MPLMEYPVRKVRRPALRRPVALRKSETRLNTSPIELRSPCATPILLDPPLRSRQSESPVTAAPKAPRVPITSEASAAFLMALESVAASSPSKTRAAVQEPTGTSVRTGCNGTSSHFPSSALRTVVPLSSTASRTFGWTPSAILSRKGSASTRRWLIVSPISSAFPRGDCNPLPEEGSCHSVPEQRDLLPASGVAGLQHRLRAGGILPAGE